MTPRDLIKSTLRLIGAIATGETPTADELADSLVTLNGMLGSWSNQTLLINAKTREPFTLTPGQGRYEVGPDADFNTVRPITILNASILENQSEENEIPIKILNHQEWQQIAVKDTYSSLPTKIYFEGTYPYETMNLWPVPSVANELILYSLKPITAFEDADVEIMLPPGYERALRYNLAMELGPEYGKPLAPQIAEIAVTSLAEIKRTNQKEVLMRSDAYGLAVNKTFNWLTGEGT